MQKVIKGGAALAAAALAVGVAAAPATAAVKPVRQADFIPALSDTRATGHVDFLREGVHIWTEGATPTDKVAEYFAYGPTLPATGNLEWLGSDADLTHQPGVQLVFDFDQTTGNGNDFNILVGEEVYGVDGSGNYTDWWLTNASSADAKAVAPSTTGGSGSAWHGTLGQWAAALPSERVVAAGFSLGSGVQGNGTIRAINLGADSYEFTDTPATVTPPAATKVDVTGDVVVKHPGRKVKLKFTSNPTPAGSAEGAALVWKVKVDGKAVPGGKITQGAGETDKWSIRFPDGKKHKVQIYKNGTKVQTVKVAAK